MNTRDKIIEILEEVKPTKKMGEVTGIIEGGYIDSFELMFLITKLCDIFKIEITVNDITAENFNSVDSITSMVERLNINKQ